MVGTADMVMVVMTLRLVAKTLRIVLRDKTRAIIVDPLKTIYRQTLEALLT